MHDLKQEANGFRRNGTSPKTDSFSLKEEHVQKFANDLAQLAAATDDGIATIVNVATEATKDYLEFTRLALKFLAERDGR